MFCVHRSLGERIQTSLDNGMKKYKLIYADPPWTFNDKGNAGKRGAGHKYQTMTLADMQLLPIEKLAAKNCLLAMWHVDTMPLEALALVKAWGFTFKKMKGFTWHKQTRNGKDHMGMGHYTRANSEDCLFAVKGSPVIVNRGIRQIITSTIGQHSEKPDQARLALEELLGNVPRIELFARRQAPGWDVWGDETNNSIKL